MLNITSAVKKRVQAFGLLFFFVLQAMIPVGYMPAPLASGSPLQLCHSVFPGLNHDEHQHHDMADIDSSDNQVSTLQCDFVVVQYVDGAISSLLFAVHHQLLPASQRYVTASALLRVFLPFHPRAPPLIV